MMSCRLLTHTRLKRENALREFPFVIVTVAKVSHMRGLWLVVRVNKMEESR